MKQLAYPPNDLFRIQSKDNPHQCVALSQGSHALTIDNYSTSERRFHFRAQVLSPGSFLLQADGNKEMVQAPRSVNQPLETGVATSEDPDPSYAWVVKPADVTNPSDGAVIVGTDLSGSGADSEYIWDVETSQDNSPVLCSKRSSNSAGAPPGRNQRWMLVPATTPPPSQSKPFRYTNLYSIHPSFDPTRAISYDYNRKELILQSYEDQEPDFNFRLIALQNGYYLIYKTDLEQVVSAEPGRALTAQPYDPTNDNQWWFMAPMEDSACGIYAFVGLDGDHTFKFCWGAQGTTDPSLLLVDDPGPNTNLGCSSWIFKPVEDG